MDQLVKPGWSFVRDNMDGFLMHGAYWNFNTAAPDVARQLASTLNDRRIPVMMEMGWPDPHDTMDDGVGARAGAADVGRLKRMAALGIHVDEVSVDWHIFIFRMVCQAHPDWKASDVLAEITGDRDGYPTSGPARGAYWTDYVSALHRAFPCLKIDVCDSPVYFRWAGMPTYGKDVLTLNPLLGKDSKPIIVDNKPVSFDFDGLDIFSALFRSSRAAGIPLSGFVTDSPADYNWSWADPIARKWHLEKIRTYERWLHARGGMHTMIINDSGREYTALNPDAWDQRFHDRSLMDLQQYQAEGGRADRYQLESWYSGPYSVVPEDKPGSFTNLVRDAIEYLKGPGQKLDLAIRKTGDAAFSGEGVYGQTPPAAQRITLSAEPESPGSFDVEIVNRGTVACMPAIRLIGNTTGWHVTARVDGQDVADLMQRDEGYVFTGMLAPGAAGLAHVELAPCEKNAHPHTFRLEAFWNPQDPGIPRDSADVTVEPGPNQK
jgi:hypothetical protein